MLRNDRVGIEDTAECLQKRANLKISIGLT